MHEHSLFSTSFPAFIVCRLFDDGHSNQCEVIFHCSFNLHFSYTEGLGAGGEGDDRGWNGWMASPTRWMWVWVNSGSWWWTGKPGVLQFMGSQRVGHDWATELNWIMSDVEHLFMCLFRSNQLLSHVWLFATPWIAACQASLSTTNSQSSLRLTSMYLLAICISSLEKCLFRSFPNFLIELFFWCWVVWAACIFWKLSLCQSFPLLFLFPILRVAFSPCLQFPLLCKNFQV